MLDLLKYKVLIVTEKHALNTIDSLETQERKRNIHSNFVNYIIPYRPTVILHELIDPTLKLTYSERPASSKPCPSSQQKRQDEQQRGNASPSLSGARLPASLLFVFFCLHKMLPPLS